MHIKRNVFYTDNSVSGDYHCRLFLEGGKHETLEDIKLCSGNFERLKFSPFL